ncbi:MAG: DUF1080 domain-containing protein, partial [Ginsengibacter sp.]
MKISTVCFAITICIIFCGASLKQSDSDNEWISLFDGKSLSGWKVGNHPETFKIEDGMIAVNGETAHLFYDGAVKNHDFKNFEFKADVMTLPGSNSGIYFHTAYQEGGWP